MTLRSIWSEFMTRRILARVGVKWPDISGFYGGGNPKGLTAVIRGDEVTEQDDRDYDRLDSEVLERAEVTEQDDTPDLRERIRELTLELRHESEVCDEAEAKLSRLQAVAALDPCFGYWMDFGERWHCNGCKAEKGETHADGCPVGRYEAEK